MRVKEKMVKRDFSKFDKEKLIKDCNILKMNNEIDKMKTFNENTIYYMKI